MAGEIQVDYTTGKTLYALIRDPNAKIWNGSAFVTYVTANLATYAIALTEQGTASGCYVGNFPSVPSSVYNLIAKVRAGGSPAEADTTAGTGDLDWGGTAVVGGGLTLQEHNKLMSTLATGTFLALK